MKKLIGYSLSIIIFLLSANYVCGQQVAGSSARIAYNYKNNKSLDDSIPIVAHFAKLYEQKERTNGYADSNPVAYRYNIKKLVIKRVLSDYSSPMKDNADDFVKSCIDYNLDCYLLPSITGLESYFGRYTYPGSHNPFGWGGGYIMFNDWQSAINTVGKGLRENYINKGADTIEQIAPIYAQSPTWSARVSYFKKIFENEEEKISLLLSKNEVEL